VNLSQNIPTSLMGARGVGGAAERREWHVTADGLRRRQVRLNGRPLLATAAGGLPKLVPKLVGAVRVCLCSVGAPELLAEIPLRSARSCYTIDARHGLRSGVRRGGGPH
jgi:hypothetical protein